MLRLMRKPLADSSYRQTRSVARGPVKSPSSPLPISTGTRSGKITWPHRGVRPALDGGCHIGGWIAFRPYPGPRRAAARLPTRTIHFPTDENLAFWRGIPVRTPLLRRNRVRGCPYIRVGPHCIGKAMRASDRSASRRRMPRHRLAAGLRGKYRDRRANMQAFALATATRRIQPGWYRTAPPNVRRPETSSATKRPAA